MILTVSPNPALDRVHITRDFQPGRQSRAWQAFLQPGGSGVHAAAVAQACGAQTMALGLLGGHSGALWQQEAERRNLAFEMLPIEGETRESFCLIDLNLGSQVEAVESGPQVEARSLDSLLVLLEKLLPEAQLLVLSGSLPPGLPSDSYAPMIDLSNQAQVPVLLDAHSEPLRLTLPHRPWLIKPNLAEFHTLIKREITGLAERAAASRELARQSGVVVALSMAEEGLLLTTPDAQWHLYPPRATMHLPGGSGRNSIGCGDALVGALAAEFCRTGDLLAAAHQNLATFGVPEVEVGDARRLVAEIQMDSLYP